VAPARPPLVPPLPPSWFKHVKESWAVSTKKVVKEPDGCSYMFSPLAIGLDHSNVNTGFSSSSTLHRCFASARSNILPQASQNNMHLPSDPQNRLSTYRISANHATASSRLTQLCWTPFGRLT